MGAIDIFPRDGAGAVVSGVPMLLMSPKK